MGRRARLDPSQATTEGQRLLCELLRRNSFGALARKTRLDESAIRHYARGRRTPSFEIRPKLKETLGIPDESWDEPPKPDTYATEPETKRPELPPTKPRPRRRAS